MNRLVTTNKKGKKRYFICGEEVTADKFYAGQEENKPDAFGTMNYKQPVVSDALMVHPDQIPEAMAHDKKSGVLGVEYLPDGRPVYNNEGQMRKAMKALKMHRNNCFY